MYQLTKDICEYLSLNEDYFFCAGHINLRTAEGRKYFCYIAINEFSIPPKFVKCFLGFAVTSTVVKHHDNLRRWVGKYPYSQIGIDIKALHEKCKDYLMEAA